MMHISKSLEVGTLCGRSLLNIARQNEGFVTHVYQLRTVTCWQCICVYLGHPVPVVPPLPEHAKLEAAKKTEDATQQLGEFLEFLQAEGISLTKHQTTSWVCRTCGPVKADTVKCVNIREDEDPRWQHRAKYCAAGDSPSSARVEHTPEGYYPVYAGPATLIAKFFNIDVDVLEAEKRALLEHQRGLNEAIEWAKTEGKKQLEGL